MWFDTKTLKGTIVRARSCRLCRNEIMRRWQKRKRGKLFIVLGDAIDPGADRITAREIGRKGLEPLGNGIHVSEPSIEP